MGSAVRDFYSGANVLITGGTGFIGKTLIRKLLSTCPEIEGIYLTVRHKKGLHPRERLKQLFECPIFKKLEADLREKVHLVEADFSLPGLGLSQQDRRFLTEKINVAFNCAGHLNMSTDLKQAVEVNVKGTAEVIALCKTMANLKSAVMVSTAYSNCTRDVIEEEFYDFPKDVPTLLGFLDAIDNKMAEKITPSLIEPWPNTYVYTKAMGESVIRQSAGDLPIGIFRPSIVTSTYKDPIPGWTDNLYGPMGLTTAVGLGFLHVMLSSPGAKADTVPVDLCVNALICTAFEINKKREVNKETDIPIYNFSNGGHWNITWKEYVDLGIKNYNYRSTKSMGPVFIWIVYQHWVFHVLHVLLHYIPAYITDFVLRLFGRKPKLMRLYKKIDEALNVLRFFMVRGWEIDNGNVKRLWKSLDMADKQMFPFDTSAVDFNDYIWIVCHGLRKYIIKETDDDLALSEMRYQWYLYKRKILKYVFFIAAVLILCSTLYGYIFS